MSKISNMPFSDPIKGTEMIEVVQDGKNKRTNPNAIREHVNAQLPQQINNYLNNSEDIIDLGLLK